MNKILLFIICLSTTSICNAQFSSTLPGDPPKKKKEIIGTFTIIAKSGLNDARYTTLVESAKESNYYLLEFRRRDGRVFSSELYFILNYTDKDGKYHENELCKPTTRIHPKIGTKIEAAAYTTNLILRESFWCDVTRYYLL